MFASESIRHTCYEEYFPLWTEKAISDLYQSAFCLLYYFKLFKTYENINALAIYTAGTEPRHMLVYSLYKNEVVVLNELFELEQFYLQYFIDFIFNKYSQIHTISLNRSRLGIANLTRPTRSWNPSEDTVIQLPTTLAEYRARLGKHTKSNLQNYLNRLNRIYPDFSFATSVLHEVEPAVISRIIEMNKLRMDGKKITSGYDIQFEKRIIHFSQKCGFTSTISIGGKIVAGTIYYEVGDCCYLEAIAHDPEFNKDRVGQVCLYLTIKHAIEQGRKEFHLLWGEYDYKYRFLGVRTELQFVSIYRSKLHKLLCVPKLLKYRAAFFMRQMSFWFRKYVLNRFK